MIVGLTIRNFKGIREIVDSLLFLPLLPGNGYMNEIYLCWGKALKPFESTPVRATHHTAVCHMLDVGIMAHVLLEQAGAVFRHLLCDPLDCADEQKIPWLAFFVALHDLGKISPGFQEKRKDLIIGLLNRCYGYPAWQARFPFESEEDEKDHGRVLFKTLPGWLRGKTGCDLTLANGLARTLAAHHGSFPADGGGRRVKKVGRICANKSPKHCCTASVWRGKTSRYVQTQPHRRRFSWPWRD